MLHAEFVQVSGKFKEDLALFEVALSLIEEKQMLEEIKEHEGNKGYGYWFRFYNQGANKLIKAKRENYASGFAELEKAHAELTAFASGKPDLNAAYKGYVETAGSCLASAKKLKRLLDDVATKSEEIDQGRESLVSSYNTLVDASNSLRELEANDLLK